jgi:hypothetical protein
MAVAGYLRVALRPPTIWTTIGHGGGGKVRGAILKSMGVHKGWPDILIFKPAGHYLTLAIGIELKSNEGSLSRSQKDMFEHFLGTNARYYVARSVDEVEGFLRGVGVPLHATCGAKGPAPAGEHKSPHATVDG